MNNCTSQLKVQAFSIALSSRAGKNAEIISKHLLLSGSLPTGKHIDGSSQEKLSS